jgi:hypothetical protein
MHSTEKPIHPEDSFLWKYDFLVSWINPLIEISNARTMTEQDVWPCPQSEDITDMCEQFWRAWYKEIDEAEQHNREPSINHALLSVFGKRFIVAGLVQLLFLVVSIGQPFLIGELIIYVQSGDGGVGVGVGYAIAFAALSMIASIAMGIALDLVRRLGVAVRSCLMLAVYEQALKLTTAARMKNTVGN